MATATHDPLRHAPDQAQTALLLIDVINDLQFDGGERLLKSALPMAHHIVALKGKAKRAGIPAIYTNDNFGRWRSDFPRLVASCSEADVRGKPLVSLLTPEDDDYFILKPRHSAFYQTNLDILLKYLGAKTLILTGVASDICVLFTAADAYLREFEIKVPADCVAAEAPVHNQQALDIMQRVLKADIGPSSELKIKQLAC